MNDPFEEISYVNKINNLNLEIKETELECIKIDLTLKTVAAESAQLELSRDKLYHTKLLEIAGYDED